MIYSKGELSQNVYFLKVKYNVISLCLVNYKLIVIKIEIMYFFGKNRCKIFNIKFSIWWIKLEYMFIILFKKLFIMTVLKYRF